jgi:hypothetical protein
VVAGDGCTILLNALVRDWMILARWDGMRFDIERYGLILQALWHYYGAAHVFIVKMRCGKSVGWDVLSRKKL